MFNLAMAESLIRLDDKHISVNQLQMCTITLEDVQLQLGLRMDEPIVTGSVQYANWGTVCVVLEMRSDLRIEMAWLRNNFVELAKDSTKKRRVRYTQTYILQIIGGILMLVKSRNLLHLRWLLELIDFRQAGELSWESAVLATLYREMYWVTKPEKIKIGGCLLLLQSWVLYRL
ncbi:serine/threonine-protein phosphatase 7 long form-like protein [Gossypium australe]|uniref:Serine/threonine-protein phosphatase 7 long form-like protein n=1 Tax=Gossypium australe TaxID=47621 RepID=A0A5B6V140_9ROSI|nr:serine/threonine-protein phosphatase 7 long form-like protein [Gossypium australe]